MAQAALPERGVSVRDRIPKFPFGKRDVLLSRSLPFSTSEELLGVFQSGEADALYPFPTAVLHEYGLVQVANTRAREILGLTEDFQFGLQPVLLVPQVVLAGAIQGKTSIAVSNLNPQTGKEKWLKITPSVVKHQGDASRSILAGIEDITEQHELRKELVSLTAVNAVLAAENQILTNRNTALITENSGLREQISNFKNRFEQMIGSIAHDLKSPLTPIKGYAQMLTRYVTDPRGLKSLERIVEQANRAEYEINEGMRMADGISKPENVDCVLGSIRENLAPVLAERGVMLEMGDLGQEIKINIGGLERSLFILINNSEEAGATQISILTEIKDGQVYFCIKDNGKGIPIEARPNVQAMAKGFSTKERKEGTTSGNGFGLNDVWKRVRKAGGEFYLQSTLTQEEIDNNPSFTGKQPETVFILRLPLVS